MIRSITAATLLALLAGLALATPSQAAPKRVVALEWDALENLLSLGVRPVGAADLGGYRTYVAIGLPGAITDVGKRQEPSIERIAKLKPDLIVVPSNRAGRNLRTLRRIARVLVTNPYPGDTHNGAQWNAMVRDFRAIARAVGQRARGESVLRAMTSRISRLRASLRKRSGTRVTIATPGGTTGSPALRLFTSNSIAAEVVRRLGLRNAWTTRPQRYGFSTVGVEALRRVQSGWLAFVYPSIFSAQVGQITRQGAYKRLDMVRKRRVKTLAGNTWLFGGPASARVFAERLTQAMR
jgi:iron complex transport system substrate-binding protein